jgi:hypothetical protein
MTSVDGYLTPGEGTSRPLGSQVAKKVSREACGKLLSVGDELLPIR